MWYLYGGMPCKSNFNGRGETRMTVTEKEESSINEDIMILTGNHAAAHAFRQAKVGVVSYVGQRESRPHDLLSRY